MVWQQELKGQNDSQLNGSMFSPNFGSKHQNVAAESAKLETFQFSFDQFRRHCLCGSLQSLKLFRFFSC